jgi:hypothetical protein
MEYWLVAFLTALVLAVPVAQGQTDMQSPNAKQMTQMQDRMDMMQMMMDQMQMQAPVK